MSGTIDPNDGQKDVPTDDPTQNEEIQPSGTRFGTTPAFPMIGGYEESLFPYEAFTPPPEPVICVYPSRKFATETDQGILNIRLTNIRVIEPDFKDSNIGNIFQQSTANGIYYLEDFQSRLRTTHDEVYQCLDKNTKHYYTEWKDAMIITSPMHIKCLKLIAKDLYDERVDKMLKEYHDNAISPISAMGQGAVLGGITGSVEAFLTEAGDISIIYFSKNRPHHFDTRFLERTALGIMEGAMWGSFYGLSACSIKTYLIGRLGFGGWWTNTLVDLGTDCAMRSISELVPSIKRSISHCNGLHKPASDRPALEKAGTNELLKSVSQYFGRFLLSYLISILMRRYLPPSEKNSWLSVISPIIPSFINSLLRNTFRVATHFFE